MSTTGNTTHRARWAAIGAAIAVTIGAGTITTVNAVQDSGERSTFTAITPCRLTDTRSGTNNVGPREGALRAAETITISAAGPAGDCSAEQLPADANALVLNVTALGASELSFLTFWPDGTQPNAASLNPAPGQPPVPNAVTTNLSDTNTFNVFNNKGNVHVVIDVAGYYLDHNHDDRYDTSDEVDAKIAANPGPTGPAGPAGAAGADGTNAMELANVITVSASGGDFTDPVAAMSSITPTAANPYQIVIGPGIYPLATQLVMKPFVHMTGSGRDTTILEGTFNDSTFGAPAGGVVILADDVEISSMSIRNEGATTDSSSAINGLNAERVTLRTVGIRVDNTESGPSAAIYLDGGSTRIDESIVVNANSSDGFSIYGNNGGAQAWISNTFIHHALGILPFGSGLASCDNVFFGTPWDSNFPLSEPCT